MTQVIDERVVEMKFDNKDFEKNVAQSMSTLEKLKQALNIDSAKSLRDITASANQVDMSHIGYAVEEVKASFSALQVVGITAISEITKAAMNLGATLINKVISPIKSGGMNRALNIEQAKFSLEALGIAWKDVEEDINYGVKDTAYGLDAAAGAAANLSASGVKLGDDMKTALRGISGVAAMTNSTYEDISSIYSTIAGQGKVMTMQLRQLEARNLNAAATLAKFLGTTEDEIRELVTKGKIDFETFAIAMDDAFGTHAKEANKTFTGAMSNVRAALSRIGANFATPYMENMRFIAVESIKVINQINKFLNPVYEDVSKIMEMVQTGVTDFLKSANAINSAHSIIISVRNIFYSILQILDPIREAFRDIFPKQETGAILRNITLAIERFTRTIVFSEKTIENVRRSFRGLFAVLDMIGMAFKSAFNSLKPLFGDFGDIASSILGFTGDIGDALVSLREYVEVNNTFSKVFRKTAFVLRASVAIIRDCFNIVKNAIVDFKRNKLDTKDFSGIKDFFSKFKSELRNFNGVGEALKKIFGGITTAFNGFKPVAKAIGEIFSSLIGGVLQGFSNAFSGGEMNAFSAFLNILSTTSAASMMMNLSNAISQFANSIKTMWGLNTTLTTIRTSLVKTFAQIQADIKADVLLRLGKAIALFAASLLVLSLIEPDRLKLATGVIVGLVAGLSLAIGGMSNLISNVKSVESFGKIFKNAFNNLANSISILIRMQALTSLAAMLVEVSIAVGILSLAIKSLGSLRPEQLIGGLFAVLTLLGALYKMAEAFANKDVFKQKAIMQGASQLILLATAVRILASAVKTIGKLPYQDVLQGVGAVFAIMFAMTEMLQKVGGRSLSVGTGMAFIELSAAVLLIGKAISQLGEMDTEQLLQGGIAVGAIGAAIAVFLKVVSELGNLGDMGSTGLAVVALAGAIYIVAQAIETLADLEAEQIGNGLVALAVAMVAMGGGLKILSESTSAGDLITTAGALVILGVAVKLIASSLALLAGQDQMAVVTSLLAVAGAIGAFVVAATLLTPVLGQLIGFAASLALFGVAVLALGAGLLMLSTAVAAFNAIGPQFLDVLLGLAIGIGAFAMAAMVLQPALVPMALLAGVLALIGVAALATGAGLLMVSAGLASIVTIGSLGAVAIEAVAVALGALSLAIIAFAASNTLLVVSVLAMVASIAAFGVSVLAASVLIGTFALAFLIATPIISAFTIVCAGAAVAVGLLATALLLLFGVLGEVSPSIKEFADSVAGMFYGVKDRIVGVIEDIQDGIRNKIGDMLQLGKDFISGFLTGLQDVPILGNIVKAASNIAQSALDAIADTQDSHSDSKEGIKLGKYLDGGYSTGITEDSDKVKTAAEDMVQGGLDTISGYDSDFYSQGENSAGSYVDGFGSMFSNFKSVCQDYKDEASDTADSVEWDMHRTMEAYNKQLKLEKARDSARERNAKIRERLEEQGIIELVTDAEKKETEAQDKNTESTKKNSSAKKEKTDVLSKLKDTLESQMDIFTKFELKTDITAEQMLENMKSNLDGFASWSARLAQLTERGISKALWEKLAAMGPKGYAELNAFVQMTDEQLQQANEMYAASMAMDDAVIAQIAPSYEKLGGQIPKGIAEGIRAWQEETTLAIQETDETMQEQMKADNEIASPSQLYYRLGTFMLEGLRLGLSDPSTLIFLTDTIHLISEWTVLQSFRDILTYEAMYGIGVNLDQGLTDGINAGAEMAYAAARTVAETVMAIIHEVTMVQSPSRATMSIGNYISEGLAIGIREGAENAYKAATELAEGTIGAIDNYGSKIASMIDSTVDMNPIITPMLDLSYIKSQVADLDSLLGDPEYGLSGQNGGNLSNQPQTISYVQNNYSPKSLSRYEIYRQTSRQLSSIRKVVTG